ncbi:MAG: CPBP family intramembrane metalloprotease [Spirochaetaceae bacterium]|jgi:membrane protease YdiL (CAAX protease family)|nr:CPBP family intramembrane metalloprotease [Spirochaetaceae bacterium]
MKSAFKNRYGELRSGWAMAAAMALIVIGQLAGRAMVPDGREDEIAIKIIVTLVYGLIVVVGGMLLFKFIYKRSLTQMGLIKDGWLPVLLHGLAIGAVSASLVFTGLILSGQAQVLGVRPEKFLSMNIIVDFLSVCVFMFSEELFCRGYIMTSLKTTRNKWVILLSSSVIFGIAHFMNPGMTILSLFNTSFIGLLFACMFVKSGKLWFPAGYHIAHNFMANEILGIATSGGVKQSQETTIFMTNITGSNELLTGGIHGPAGGFLMTGVILLGFFYVRFFVKTPNVNVWTMESDLPLTRGGWKRG